MNKIAKEKTKGVLVDINGHTYTAGTNFYLSQEAGRVATILRLTEAAHNTLVNTVEAFSYQKPKNITIDLKISRGKIKEMKVSDKPRKPESNGVRSNLIFSNCAFPVRHGANQESMTLVLDIEVMEKQKKYVESIIATDFDKGLVSSSKLTEAAAFKLALEKLQKMVPGLIAVYQKKQTSHAAYSWLKEG